MRNSTMCVYIQWNKCTHVRCSRRPSALFKHEIGARSLYRNHFVGFNK